MKKLLAVLLVFGTASTAFGFDRHEDGVHWRGIAGVIAVQGGNNPIGDPEHAHVDSGTFAWTTRRGEARVNLDTGAMAFHVDGLVINGTAFSGTPGPVTGVIGTLVCNLGALMAHKPWSTHRRCRSARKVMPISRVTSGLPLLSAPIRSS
jgi:hypothetical protein